MHLTEHMIEQYALGKLDETDLAGAEEHLLVCPECREHVELIGLIVAGLRDERVAGRR